MTEQADVIVVGAGLAGLVATSVVSVVATALIRKQDLYL